jgi:hypothetical protein
VNIPVSEHLPYVANTKEELIKHYAGKLAMHGLEDGESFVVARDRLMTCAMQKCVYVPHLYRGGWVIPGYGWSTERIGVFVESPNIGSPLAVFEGRY